MSAYNQTDIKKKNHQISPVFIVIIIIAVLFLGVFIGRTWDAMAQKNSNKEASIEPKKTETQTVLTVEPIYAQVVDVPVSLSAEGTVVAANEATVNAKVAGIALERVLVDEGDWVKKGQALAILDTKGLKQQIIQANANMVKARTSFESAKADVARVQPLLKISAVSEQEYERYVSQAKQAKASIVAAKAVLDNQKNRFNDAKVVAPISGIISKKTAAVGAVPQGTLFTIIENGQLEWEAQVNAQDLAKIKKGTDVVVNAISDGNKNQQALFGKVIRINPVLENNRQARVRVALKLPNKQSGSVIQAGMLLTGKFIIGVQPQQLVPSSTLVNSDGYNYLMLIDDVKQEIQDKKKIDIGTINKLKVDIGERFNDVVVIKTKLPTLKQRVVKQGGSFLNDGDSVRLVQTERTSTKTNRANPSTPKLDSMPTTKADVVLIPKTSISAPIDKE